MKNVCAHQPFPITPQDIFFCFTRREFDDPELLQTMQIFDTSNELVGNGLLEDTVAFLPVAVTSRARQLKTEFGKFMDFINYNVDDHRKTLSNGEDISCFYTFSVDPDLKKYQVCDKPENLTSLTTKNFHE